MENAADNEYTESEQSKPLIEKNKSAGNANEMRRNYEKQNTLNRKSIGEAVNRPLKRSSTLPNDEGIELANDGVCPFGLAKNLEKQIQIIPSRKKSKCLEPFHESQFPNTHWL